ncbi:MAG: hypothetical protein HY918_02240 [Candidatus Doudnabacteria bacterium]|nr:hypothetical protein [Candidatus Doudnabacteria bacterium]
MQENKAFITRHADKGTWQINKDELKQNLPEDEANLVLGVLSEELPEKTETTLKMEGLIRSLRLGDKVFESLPQGRNIVISIDSAKDRAKLTNDLVCARIDQLSNKNKKTSNKNGKDVDIIRIEDLNLRKLLSDADEATWAPYADMMKNEGISENEALVRWMNDMYNSKPEVDDKIHPTEAIERHQKLIKNIFNNITSENSSITFLGIGHSGTLGYFQRENMNEDAKLGDEPEFCQIYQFNTDGKFLNTAKIKA